MCKISKIKLSFIIEGGLIAAIYIMLTGFFQPIAFGPVQVRIPEALCAAALFRFSAVPGVTLGCLISNILWSPFGFLDVFVGTLATLIGCALTYMLRNRNRLVALTPPVIVNALMVPIVLSVMGETAYWLGFIYILAGQAIACYGIGLTLARGLEHTPFAKKQV